MAATGPGASVVVFPASTCLMLGAMVIPYTGTSHPTQAPLRLTGSGGRYSGYYTGTLPTGGSVLDMRYGGAAGVNAKIDTRGAGVLEIDHLTIMDGTTDNFTFIWSTNTTLKIHDNVFIGNPTCFQNTCAQKAIQLGGTDAGATTLQTNAQTAGFQGYSTLIENNQFERIAIAVGFGGSANGIAIRYNNISATSGSSDATRGAPFVCYGNALGSTGVVLKDNEVELTGYAYGLNTVNGGGGCNEYDIKMSLWDEVLGVTKGGFYWDTGNGQNTVQLGFASTALRNPAGSYALFDGPAASSQTLITGGPTISSAFASGLNVGTWTGTGAGQIVVNIRGGATNSADGAAVYFNNGASGIGSIGNLSAIIGGAYDGTYTIYANNNKIYMRTSQLGVNNSNPSHSLDWGAGTGTISWVMSAGTGTGNGGYLAFSPNVYIGNYSAIQGGAYNQELLLGSPGGFQFNISNADAGNVDNKGHWQLGESNAPTIASGACGTTTNGSIVAGSTDRSGQINIGAAATTACTVSFAQTWGFTPRACTFSPANATAAGATILPWMTPPTTTQFVLNGAVLASTNWMYACE